GRKLEVMQDVHHHDIGCRAVREREPLRVGDTVEPRCELNVGRDDVAEALLEIADAAADLDRRSGSALGRQAVVEISVDRAQDRFAVPQLRLVLQRVRRGMRVCVHADGTSLGTALRPAASAWSTAANTWRAESSSRHWL